MPYNEVYYQGILPSSEATITGPGAKEIAEKLLDGYSLYSYTFPTTGSTQYAMLKTVRDYTFEKLISNGLDALDGGATSADFWITNSIQTISLGGNGFNVTNASGVGNGGLLRDGASFGTAVAGIMTTMVQGSAELTQADALAEIKRANRVIASEKAAFKTMGKFATGAKFLGSALGVVSIADHSTKAWNSFSKEGFFSVNGWLNVGKVGIDGALMLVKSNPVVLILSIGYGVADASGYLDCKA